MRLGHVVLILILAPASFAIASDATTQPAPQPSLFRDAETGEFDVSGFLSTKQGFLPIAMPITEPAVGYGLSLGLSFFHDKPQAVPDPGGGPPRVIMPSTTVLFGAGTENGTWATGIAHLGVWNQGKIRYIGAAGYASLNLDWFGRDDALNGRSISYTNDVVFFYQRITFKLGDSDFYIGPQYRFIATDAAFSRDARASGVTSGELQSQTSGLGVVLSYDSLDQPFSPTRGIRAEATYSQQSTALGGDFDYGRLQTYFITYIPFTDKVVLGLRADGAFNFGDAPFYDLPSLFLRGIPRGRYVDNAAVFAEAELRYDFARRWTVVGFGGVGRVADTIGDLGSADTRSAVGAGFRYLIAREYGLRMGLDAGYSSDGDWTVYVTVGTGWIRP